MVGKIALPVLAVMALHKCAVAPTGHVDPDDPAVLRETGHANGVRNEVGTRTAESFEQS